MLVARAQAQGHGRIVWLAAHALAFGLGAVIVVFGTGPAGRSLRLDDWSKATRSIIVLAAVFTSLAQGYLLRRQFRQWWAASLLGSVAGAGLALIAEFVMPDVSAPPIGYMVIAITVSIGGTWLALMGLGQGLAQGVLLRGQAPHAGRWALSSCLRWILSVPAGWMAHQALLLGIGLVLLPLSQRLAGSQTNWDLMIGVTLVLFWVSTGAILGVLTRGAVNRALLESTTAPHSAGTVSAAGMPAGETQTAGPVLPAVPQLAATAPRQPGASVGVKPKAGLNLWGRWLPAHLAAAALGALLGALVELALEPNLFDPGPPYHAIGDQAIPAGYLLGTALIGLAQGLVLRRRVPGWWRASLLGSLVGLAVGTVAVVRQPFGGENTVPVMAGMPLGMLRTIGGWLIGLALLLGLAQSLALRRGFPRAWFWLPMNLVAVVVAVPAGWFLNLMWGMPLAMLTSLLFSTARASQMGNVLGGLVLVAAGLLSYGALIALVTGLALGWVLRRPAVPDEIPPSASGQLREGSNLSDFAQTG